MKLIYFFLLVTFFTTYLWAEEKIDINFKDLKVMELITITSKILNKNILVTEEINGEIDYISNKTVSKNELIKILMLVLKSKGHTLLNEDNILRVIKLDESTKNNLPVINSSTYKEENYK